jgi:hypothetical protein
MGAKSYAPQTLRLLMENRTVDSNTFRQLVYDSAPEKMALRSALDDFTRDHGPDYHQNEVSQVYQLVREKGDLMGPAPARRERKEQPLFADTPWSRTAARDRLDAIGPWVEDLRREVVAAAAGRVTLPLATISQAAEWIEEEDARSRKGIEPTTIDGRRVREVLEDTRDRLREMGAAYLAETLHAGFRVVSLAYVKPGSEWTHNVPVRSSSPLHPLARGVAEMAKATGFLEAQMTLHVLTGYRPRLGPARITTHPGWHALASGGGLLRTEVTVTFRTPEVSFDQLRAIHAQVREEWGSARQRPLSRRGELVIQAVEAAAESATWRDKMRGVNSQLRKIGKTPFRSPDALRMAYKAARRALPAPGHET